MKRRAFNLLSAISLLLCIATGVLWSRCGAGAMFVERQDAGRVVNGFVTQRSRRLELATGRLFFQTRSTTFYKVQTYPESPPNPDGSIDMIDPKNATWENPPLPAAAWGYGRLDRSTTYIHRPHRFLGFMRWGYGDAGPFSSRLIRGIAFPIWWIIAVTVVLPVIGLVKAVRSRRSARRGFCVSCGYDLRASPERCPECGTAIKPE